MECDVLVIGAGPAGSSLATHLARRGVDVVVADRKDFPRHKPCGEFLSPECTPYLRELGVFEEIAAKGPHTVRGMQLHGYDRRAIGRFRRIGPRAESALRGLAIRREQFDHVLLLRARSEGAAWLPRHSFHSVLYGNGAIAGARLRDPGGHLVECRARWVIGADGVRSPLARELGVQRPIRWLDRLALVTHYRGVEPREHAEVHMFHGGFFAATTVDDGLFSVNLVVDRALLHGRSSNDWDAFFAEHCEAAPPLRERMRGAQRVAPWRGTGPLAFTTKARTFDGAALVGDACGYIDPITGEGIYYALFGGRELATAIERALAAPRDAGAAMAAYEKARRREIGPRITASRLLQRALRHPWLVRSFLRAAERWPTLADVVVTMTGDTVHPRELRSLRFWRSLRQVSA